MNFHNLAKAQGAAVLVRARESNQDIRLIVHRTADSLPLRYEHLRVAATEVTMADEFEYVSHARLVYDGGFRKAYLGEVPEPVTYGVQGKLREYYGVKEGPPVASTLDHIVAAVAG